VALLTVLASSGCSEEAPAPALSLDVHCSEGVDFPSPVPSLESGPHRVTVRHLFPAEGCPSLRADLLRVPAGGYLVRVVELEGGARSPGPEEGAFRATYTLSIEGLTPGRHQLRLVHVPLARPGEGSRSRAGGPRAPGTVTLVFDHPVLVLSPP